MSKAEQNPQAAIPGREALAMAQTLAQAEQGEAGLNGAERSAAISMEGKRLDGREDKA